MIRTLKNVITKNKNGLFLLDLPTGFGKTTAVVEIIKDFIKGNPIYKDVKRIFFVTNLITNLPYYELLEQLTDEEKKVCFQAKATIEYVLDNFLETPIKNSEVSNSKEYKNLKREIEAYKDLKKSTEENAFNGARSKSLEVFKQKISTDTEPAFRNFIKNRFIYNKSIADRNKFLSENAWVHRLYPICDIEKYKVVFLTTQKFISPIDTFRRLPFYAFNDDITKDALVFIDEFDSTKRVVLDQLIEDGTKNQIDIFSLFLDLHFAMQHITIPQNLLRTTSFNQEKVARGEWHPTEDHFDYWKNRFNAKYLEHELHLLVKSENFTYDKAFLFDDGKYFHIVKDNSKKYIYTKANKEQNYLALLGMPYNEILKPFNKVIRDLEYCIDGFMHSIFYISNNYFYYKNESRPSNETKYTKEEAIYTVLDLLNLSEEQKKYLYNKILMADYIFGKPNQYGEMRKGFNYTVIEDSNYHDMKSVSRCYSFPSTPEDILVKLSKRALVVGISATAKVSTCIGNYDLKYLKSELKDSYIEIDIHDEKRLIESFSSMINKLDGTYHVHAQIVDDFEVFSDREKCSKLIENLFSGDRLLKYSKLLNDNNQNYYYFLIELKLAKVYKEIGENNIKSFVAFLNRLPAPNDEIDSIRLAELFEDIREQNKYEKKRVEIVSAHNFDSVFKDIQKDLEQNKPVFVITTYQTVGTGKNIQYKISKETENKVVLDTSDSRRMKDFEGIYLLTPTNLIQKPMFDSDDKYNDLARFLFHQEYLCKNGHLTYPQFRSNIVYGFKQIFFGENSAHYTKNGDIYLHTLKVAIQAVGRICRCRHKNKDIYIYADRELVDRVQIACDVERPNLLNKEFEKLLELDTANTVIPEKLIEYSKQSKQAYTYIRRSAWTVRNSRHAVLAWQELRDFVLKNPTTSNPGNYSNLYFEFDTKYTGYSYQQNNRFDIVKMVMDTRYAMTQVSEQECDLPTILSIDYIDKMFDEQHYVKKFKAEKYVMTPSLFKQIYLGALGEVVGKCILERELGLDLEELEDISFYEYFDYKIGNIYFDFKHWHLFEISNEMQVKKVENKLSKIKGAKCFVINILKRNDAPVKVNLSETVIQIPYLIDGDDEKVNSEAIDYIGELYWSDKK